VVTQFGRPLRSITEPGLYFKLPDPIQVVKKFDRRIIVSESALSEVLTSDKKNLVVDYYVAWRIVDPLLFLQSVVNEQGARYRMVDIVYSNLRLQIGLHELSEVISKSRDNVNGRVLEGSRDQMSQYGIELLDVKIRRVDFPEQNKRHVYERMRAERTKMANLYRSEGKEEATKIQADADRNRTMILSSAFEKSSIIKGEGDAEAARVYARILSVDPEFYGFVRTLEAYKKIFNSKDKTLVLNADSELFRVLKGKT